MKLIAFLAFLASHAMATNPTLIGGSEALPGEFEEVIKIRHERSSCSAAVVGEYAVLTAGHCVSAGGKIEYQIGQVLYSAVCERTKKYNETEYHHDMAICKSDKPMKVKYAHVSLKGPAHLERVTLIGYGCHKPGGGGGYGILRYGIAPVTRLAGGDSYWFYTESQTALCFGDSGGPAFKKVISPKDEIHYIYGVNSRGDIRSISLLTAVYLPESQLFLKAWSEKHKVDVCGLTSDCKVKRSGDKSKCRWKLKKLDRARRKFEKAKEKYEACLADA